MADIKDWRSLSDTTPEWEAVRHHPNDSHDHYQDLTT
jgi:hypothetical protein